MNLSPVHSQVVSTTQRSEILKIKNLRSDEVL